MSDVLKNHYRDANSLRYYFDDAVPPDLFRGRSKSEAKQGLPLLHPNPDFTRKDGSVRLPDVKVVERDGRQVVLGCRCLAGDCLGVSTFGRKNTKLGGFMWHRLPKDTPIPAVLAITQDSDVSDRANHFTIAPKDDMPLELSQVWLNDLGKHMQDEWPTMSISFDTLTLAIKAVLRDIERHEALSPSDDDEDTEYHGQYVLDLQRALGELGNLYRQVRQQYPGSPTLDELVGGD